MANQEVNDMERARQFREAKMAQPTNNNTKQDKGFQENTKEKESRVGSLRRKIRAVKRAEKIQRKKEKKMKGKTVSPARLATNRLLRQAWIYLIPSWGLTSIYIDFHVFLRFALGENLFCKLGDEWLPRQIRIVSGKAGKTAGKAIGIIESMVLLFVNIIMAAIITIIIAIITFVVDSVTFKVLNVF